MDSELIRKARAFAEKTFQEKVFENHVYHNLEHTRDVVKAVEEIGTQSGLTDDELEMALVAAWFHDTGYRQGDTKHEESSADLARTHLNDWGVSFKKVQEITEAIMATRMPQQPHSMVSRVLCDADLYHLATEDCNEKSAQLREEWATVQGTVLSDNEWLRSNLEFMRNHRYHTAYGQTVLEPGKKQNIKKIKKLLKQEAGGKKYDELENEVVKLRSKLEREKMLKPDRGIETMFRTTSSNHIMLSEMADNKANILITINSIILSVVVSVLVRKIEENPNLMLPTIMLIAVCLTTTVFAILATRPNVSAGRFNRDDVKNKRTNLLFFGNFHSMEIEHYEWAMKQMMKDGDYLYGSMIKDIYYLGKVLGRKYKFLRLSYNVFMFGFVLSIISFIIAMLVTKPAL